MTTQLTHTITHTTMIMFWPIRVLVVFNVQGDKDCCFVNISLFYDFVIN